MKRLVCVTPVEQINFWQTNEDQLNKDFELHFIAPTRINEWGARSDGQSVDIVLVDLDSIAQTKPLDASALRAWRNALQSFLMQCRSDNGYIPPLWGFSGQRQWYLAKIAFLVGVRDLFHHSELVNGLKNFALGQIGNFQNDIDLSSQIPANVIPFQSSPKNSHQEILKSSIPFPIAGLEGTSQRIETVRSLIRKCAPLDTPVLIEGHTGTGKELVARAIHQNSNRADKPFVSVQLASLNENLFEAELFGYLKGSFTGAERNHKGFASVADGGTLFLDEITEIAPNLQIKLLRLLQEKKFRPLGSGSEENTDCRIISATNKNIDQLVREGSFREDLYFRIKVLGIHLPDLKDRLTDLPDIAQSTINKLARKNGKEILEISNEVLEKLLNYGWPGNVRELESSLEFCCALAWAEKRKELRIKDLPETLRFAKMASPSKSNFKEAVRQFERNHIIESIYKNGGSKERAAQTLGLSMATLYRKLGS